MIVWAVFLAWFLAQLCKVVHQKKGHAFWESGGMPSSHAAVVTALCGSIYVESGFSLLFAACVVFSLIILHDALTVRWQAGVQAGLLNQLLSAKKRAKTPLSKSLGHRPSEVLAGIALGLLVVIAFYL